MRFVKTRLFLVLAGSFIGLLLAELLIRITLPAHYNIMDMNNVMESERGKFARHDKNLGWDGLTDAENDFVWLDMRHHVRQNNYGYRGKAYDLKRNKKKRILVMGDSFVWGFGVENEDIFTSVIERETNNTIEVINMGVSGYGNDQEYLLWKKKGYQWTADEIIVVIYADTDLFENVSDFIWGYDKPVFRQNSLGELTLTPPGSQRSEQWTEPAVVTNVSPVLWFYKILSKSALANMLVRVATKNDSIRHFLESHKVIFERSYILYPEQYIVDLTPELKKSWDIMFKILDKFHEEVTRNRANFWIVIVPTIEQVYPELWNKFLKSDDLPSGKKLDPAIPNKRIVDWCVKNKIHVIDLLPQMREAGLSNPYLYYPLNRHWTRDGHLVAARFLLSELR
ncbi:MAG: SGNH/GDSL hydrolase family protein [Syntrophaceae bacterium]|nr:SGNH/GDSL hydrolase family protein [Syntrophaceae bacterium]